MGKEIKINGPNPHKWGHFGPTSVVSELVSDNAGGGMFVKHEEKKCRGGAKAPPLHFTSLHSPPPITQLLILLCAERDGNLFLLLFWFRYLFFYAS